MSEPEPSNRVLGDDTPQLYYALAVTYWLNRAVAISASGLSRRPGLSCHCRIDDGYWRPWTAEAGR